MINFSNKTLFVIAAIVFVALSRLLPHPSNFTPVAAIALFGGAFLNNKRAAFLITLLALLVSDLLVNGILYNNTDYLSYASQPFVWSVFISFGITVWMGIYLQNKVSIKNVAIFSVCSSIMFWLITNFACWPANPIYSQNLSGLKDCYVAAIPFFKGSLIGDLFYNTILFGTMFLAVKRIPAVVKA